MSTYTKHITHLNGTGRWELSFDLVVSVPDVVTSSSDLYSAISISNPEVTFIAENSVTLTGSVDSHLRINNQSMGMYSIGERTVQITSGQTFSSADYFVGRLIEYPFENVVDFNIKHDENGEGSFTIDYTLSFYPNVNNNYNDGTISFYFDVQLERIDLSHLPLNAITDDDKQALVTGNTAILTKLIVNNVNNISPLSNVDVINESDNTNILTLTESDAIKTWELNDERYVPEVGFIGQFVARTLSGELHNITDDFSIQDTDVELQIGIVRLGTRYQLLSTENGRALLDENGNKIYINDLGSDLITWYSLGNFLITKPEDDEVADNTKFEAFDYTTKFNIDFNADYVDSVYTISFNDMIKRDGGVTLHWLASYTCAQVGIVFANNTFTNSEFLVPSNQFTQGESCRDVMKAIAELAFGWCRIGWDNKCYIDEPQTVSLSSDDTNVLTNDNYYSLTTQKQIYGPINKVVIGMSAVTGQEAIVEDADSIENFGKTEILIMDNPILYTPELREEIKESAKKLFGLYYSPIEMETPGHPWLIGNELIDVQDMEGNSRFTYPFNRTLNYTGHIKSKVISPATTVQEKETEYKQQIFKTIKDIGIKVDAQEGKITAVNASVEATKSGLESIERRFETEVTDTYSKTQIQEIINGTAEDGTVVSSVTTTAGTFDKNGLTIEQSGSATKTNINSNGMIIYNTSGTSTNDELLNVNSEGVNAKNIKVSKYLNIGSHSRMEDYTHTDYKQGTGVFWIGSDY